MRFIVAGETLRAIAAGRSLELAACQRQLSLARPEREALATFVEHQLEAATSEEAAAASPGPGDAGEQTADNRIRAELDRRRDVLFACVSQPVLGVRVRWDASGSVSVSLNGALAGTPEEECVRSQLQSLGVPEATEAGEVVHVLSR